MRDGGDQTCAVLSYVVCMGSNEPARMQHSCCQSGAYPADWLIHPMIVGRGRNPDFEPCLKS